MKKTKDKNIFRESDSKKNIFLWPQLLLSLLLSELQPIFLLRNCPIFLGRSPDLLWALWGQLRLKPVHTPTCTCFQIPQLPPNATPSSQLWAFNLLLLWLQEEIHFLFGHTASVAHTLVLPCLCRLRSGVCFPPRQDRADTEAYRTHSLSWAGKREGYGRPKWNVRGGPGAVKAFGVAAA